jgi:hypothetical protein
MGYKSNSNRGFNEEYQAAPGMLLSPNRFMTYVYPLLLYYFTILHYMNIGCSQKRTKEDEEYWSQGVSKNKNSHVNKI